jgi:hypothetical protein
MKFERAMPNFADRMPNERNRQVATMISDPQ